MPHLIGVDELDAARRASAAHVRILDVRWRLDAPEGRPEYLGGHIPGAVYVDLERELARPGYPEDGRHPLPDDAALRAAVRRWGVRTGDLVVAYDDNHGVAAARAWWLLRRRGIDIRVLDAGLRGWVAARKELARGDHAPREGDVELDAGDPGVLTIDDAAHLPREGVLIDARSAAHYRGNAPGVDPAQGHIPGAVNIPTIIHIAGDGRLREPEDIRATLASRGIVPGTAVGVYCSSGIASAHSVLAYAVAGIDARLYPGSWSQWSRTRGRSVATGRTPADTVRAV